MIARVVENEHQEEACQVTSGRKHVVILGGGFGGVYAAIGVRKDAADVIRRST